MHSEEGSTCRPQIMVGVVKSKEGKATQVSVSSALLIDAERLEVDYMTL